MGDLRCRVGYFNRFWCLFFLTLWKSLLFLRRLFHIHTIFSYNNSIFILIFP
ncbi:hypothetical protein Hdeb2414_s0003g00098791 [Helianthus debilis subsp. tardiflorus]